MKHIIGIEWVLDSVPDNAGAEIDVLDSDLFPNLKKALFWLDESQKQTISELKELESKKQIENLEIRFQDDGMGFIYFINSEKKPSGGCFLKEIEPGKFLI